MLNTNSPVEISIAGAEGIKTALCRWPTDQEWAARQAKRKIVQKNIGRGQTEIVQSDYSAVDLDLYQKIRQDGAPDLDEFESSDLIGRLAMCEVTGAEVAGSEIRVECLTPAGPAVHVLGMPSAKDRFRYAQSYLKPRDLSFGRQEITIHLAAPAELYDANIRQSEGYASPVPIIHKAAVVSAALQAVQELLDGDGTRPNS
mgnify:CR=1 FL=1